MRAVVLYHPQSDHIGLVEGFVHDFKRFKGKDIEKISLETVEGSEMARLHDVTRYPALLIIGPNGTLQKLWQGDIMPLMDEVDSFLPVTQGYDQELAKGHLLTVQPL